MVFISVHKKSMYTFVYMDFDIVVWLEILYTRYVNINIFYEGYEIYENRCRLYKSFYR